MSSSPQDRRPIVISGPSGVGKGTLIQKLFNTHPETFALAVSHTTRSPRPGEVEGIAYYFVCEDEFKSLIAENAFVEHTFFSGHHYGTSKMTIENQTTKGLIVVLDIEMHGIQQMKENPSFEARYIFIRPPSLQALEERLRNRGTESDRDVEKRLAQAKIEMEYADSEDAYDKIIVNDDFDKAFEELDGFIYDAA
ncbi:hypothetical protein PENARI_c004G00043 [Penicillium arizonense]|uniref:Guanylate kinase n=1 Tax=Penicillium arizonense TaxID=1835702 RepID=A0A1F5LRP0_PENAI|nr:hypothetical protein PENARI_c004G00043 [Penicillium arizonense]OGE55521.1 hypothetical protein PENARI_c004G00043 [Penicillium arizonense]